MRLDGMALRLADHEDVRSLGLRRAWDVQLVKRQDGDPEQEFSLALSMFNLGYGYSFGLTPGTYETAHQFDTSAFGKAKTWAPMADSESLDEALSSGTRRGWLYFNFASGYLYLLRGRFAAKYRFTGDTDATWSIIEYHDFGDDRAVSGRWAEFNGKVYVPLINTSTGAEARFHELTAVGDPVDSEQTLTQSGSPTGGTFTISFDSGYGAQETEALDFDATAQEVQTALRALPGLQKVTVERSGTTTDFVWTVTLTAAPTANGTDAPPALTVDDSGLTGGTTPEITVATVVNGVGDEWNLGPDTVVARYFAEWNKPGVGPVLARAYQNFVSVVAGDPMDAGDWGAGLAAGSSTYRINAIATLDRYLIIGKQNMLGLFDEQGDFVTQISSIAGIVSDDNFVGMLEHNGAMFMPHKLGLIRWRIGERYRFIGAEQDGMFEADRHTAAGHGRAVAIAPYGKYLYEAILDEHDHEGHPFHAVISSLQEPGSEMRGPLTPQMHFNNHGIPEDLITVSLTARPQRVPLTEAESSAATGDVAWSDPENALADNASAATAEGVDTETTEPLVLTNSAATHIPPSATIEGVSFQVRRRSEQAQGAWTVIDSRTLAEAASSISFASGLTGYTFFRVTAYVIKDGTGGDVGLRFNNDSGTNYDYQRLSGSDTLVAAARVTGQTLIDCDFGALQANQVGTYIFAIAKQVSGSAAMAVGGSVAYASGPVLATAQIGGRWNNTADLINRIDLVQTGGNFAAGTVVVLEGA